MQIATRESLQHAHERQAQVVLETKENTMPLRPSESWCSRLMSLVFGPDSIPPMRSDPIPPVTRAVEEICFHGTSIENATVDLTHRNVGVQPLGLGFTPVQSRHLPGLTLMRRQPKPMQCLRVVRSYERESMSRILFIAFLTRIEFFPWLSFVMCAISKKN